ncbi:Uncharacterised protein [Staphylococcus epidermidis]|jgi:ABC-type antimicrobial peptide transport system permease subunit|nr:hypothetical protein F6I04_11270 [Staphylococcus epidermidis]KAA9318919.1 hypothetical protein F6H98_01715 [Staphylococcus epidermidis]KAB2180198.1 hypothetical protein F9B26_00250 [Staphylococcus epidermidis]KAB2280236.1 hypothetical protein F9B70_11740 [Staphylococcus epidermidis]NAM14870.1 hypothetical protein [Staphylococcus epidermidis]
MLKNVKYPHAKILFDIVGIISSISILLLITFNLYLKFESNGNVEIGVKWNESSLYIGLTLLVFIIFCAIISYVLKFIKRN